MGPGAQPQQPREDSAGVRVPPPLTYVGGFLLGVGLEQSVATPDLPGAVALAAALLALVLAGVLDGYRTYRTQVRRWI